MSGDSDIVEFGRFRVHRRDRTLLADGSRLDLGARAIEVLLALIDAGGAVVSKDGLLSRVWPDAIVEENNLHVQIFALRRALGADRNLIRTVPRHGYSFTGHVMAAAGSASVARAVSEPTVPSANLPIPLGELIGRETDLRRVIEEQANHRLLTLTGPGGIGKTSLAIAAAWSLVDQYPDGVRLADLATVADPELVLSAIAAALDLSQLPSPLRPEHVATRLGSRRLLLVLDNCEHLIEPVARVAEAMLHGAPHLRILATSREPLRTGGECVYSVPALAVPGEEITDTDAQLRHSAVRLFVARARLADARLPSIDCDAGMIADICRRLDGIPLAIELAASRAVALGVRGVADGLDDRFRLLAGGLRTALPRHQTLRATLDWSYALLSETERAVLRRLAIFSGGFELESARAIMTTDGDDSDVLDTLADLVAKSLVIRDSTNAGIVYRLLDTTRTYALEKLAESGGLGVTAQRHAEYYAHLFERAEPEWETQPTTEWAGDYGRQIGNLRAALDWAFSPGGDASIGVRLTAAAVAPWMYLSLMDECSRWTAKAIASLAPDDYGTRREMLLRFGLGFSTMVTIGVDDRARNALTRALELAETFHHAQYQLRALASLCIFQLRLGEFRGALALGRRCETVARGMSDPHAMPTADRLLGAALCLLGEHESAHVHLQQALDRPMPDSERRYAMRFGPDHRANSFAILATNRWLQGFPEQALQASRLAIEVVSHPASLCLALFVGGGLVSRWVGDLATAERLRAELIAQAERHSLSFYHSYGLALNGMLIARRGDPTTGANLMRAALDRMHKTHYFIWVFRRSCGWQAGVRAPEACMNAGFPSPLRAASGMLRHGTIRQAAAAAVGWVFLPRL